MPFADEIKEQAVALRDLAHFYNEAGASLLEELQRTGSGARRIVFTGMGSSQHACLPARCYLADNPGIPAEVWEAGELLHFGLSGIGQDDLVVVVSQSGESVETRKVTETLRDHPRLVAVTNSPNSTMGRTARLMLPMIAGAEATISTKTFSNGCAVLLLMAAALAGSHAEPLLARMVEVASVMDDFNGRRKAEISDAGLFLRDAVHLYFVSRGAALAAAAQAALTFQEGVHITTSWMPAGSFRHGPLEAIEQGRHVAFYAAANAQGDMVRAMAAEVADLGACCLLFTALPLKPSPSLLPIHIPADDPLLFPIACAVPQELLLAEMADARGWTAGVFRRGGKITGRE